MKPSPLEPGLLPVFRLFTGLRLAFTGLAVVAGLALAPWIGDEVTTPHAAFLPYFRLAEAALLMIYLSWPPVQRRMGRAFLPAGLAIAALGPIVGQAIEMSAYRPSLPAMALVSAWQIVPMLLIPLVLTGWQYNFRAVLLFSLGTALVDGALTLANFSEPDRILASMIGVILIRTFTYILAGFMIARLMDGQRRQQSELTAANTRLGEANALLADANTQLAEANARLAEANARLAHYAAALEGLATSRERNRLARELHDTLAHSLSGVAVQLEAVAALWEASPHEARAMLERSLAATRSGLTETRRALKALRASPLEDLGLALAVRSLAESDAARYGLELALDTPPAVENLSPDVEQAIYRVAQEALENIGRHAQARRVSLSLSQLDGRVTLAIHDDGVGFDPHAPDQPGSYGLQGLRERSEALGGDLSIDSRPGRGTTVRLEVPVG